MNKKTLFSIRELIVILLSGGLPLFIAYKLGGLPELEVILGALIAPKLLLYYCSVLPIVFIVFYILEKYIYINPLSKKHVLINFVISTLYELSSNIIGIFRFASGVLVTLPFLVLINEPSLFKKVFSQFFFYGLLGAVEVIACYWWLSKVKLKQIF